MARSPITIFTGSASRPHSYDSATTLALQLVTGWPGYHIPDGTTRLKVRTVGVISHYPPNPIGESITQDWFTDNIIGIGSYGVLYHSGIDNAFGRLAANSIGIFTIAETIDTSVLFQALGIRSLGTIYLGVKLGTGTVNWIKWSDIGDLDFTIGKDNVAGERPLDWRGKVYAIKKLDNRVVAYGAGGVSFLMPAENTAYGLNTIYRVGLKGVSSVAGDESKHFFIDSEGKLWKLSDSLQLLGYKEFLASLNTNVVMSYDAVKNVVYICDGTTGYIYDVASKNLGGGPSNITSLGYQNGVSFVGASGASITNIPFEICTDIYDLGTRAGKTIYSLEFGVDVTENLYAAIDYRRNKAANFTQTPWYLISQHGRVFITAYGREFRFRLKTTEYESFELDYIKIGGILNDY